MWVVNVYECPGCMVRRRSPWSPPTAAYVSVDSPVAEGVIFNDLAWLYAFVASWASVTRPALKPVTPLSMSTWLSSRCSYAPGTDRTGEPVLYDRATVRS